jgi:hypothetical protein
MVWLDMSDTSKRNLLLGVLFVLLLIAGYVFFIKDRQSVVSGHLDFNGVAPENSTLSILAKESSKKNYQTVASNLPVADGEAWSWQKADKGTTYDIQAVLVVNHNSADKSEILTTTAPSVDNVLTINSNQPAPQEAAIISGSIDLNGPVTVQSYVSLLVRGPKEADFQPVASQISAVDGEQWSWNGAAAGAQYQVKAVLYVNSTYAGESQVLTVNAPARNESLRINSQYNPPPQKTTISGSVSLSGSVPGGATLSISKQASTDSAPAIVAQNIPAINGVDWSWSNALSGVEYSMQATLYNNSGQQISQSQLINLTAPAANEVFNIAANNNLQQPVNSPTASCVNQSNGSWTVNVNYQSVSGAKRYWLQVGDQPRSNDVADYQSQTSGANYQVYAVSNLQTNKPYFAQYAYANCANCTASNSFSPFSNTLQFSCNNLTPTPTPTAVPPPTATPTSTTAPSPLPTQGPLQNR